jgi:hypothetical protein
MYDTDYVVVSVFNGSLVYWTGRRQFWAFAPTAAHIYRTRAQAEAAINRFAASLAFRYDSMRQHAMYCTMSDIEEGLVTADSPDWRG